MKHPITLTLVVLLGASAAAALAAPQGGPPSLTTFADGTPALAAEVNGNFQALVDREDLNGENIVNGSLTFDELSQTPGDWAFESHLRLMEGSLFEVAGDVRVLDPGNLDVDGVLRVGTTIPDGIVSARAAAPNKTAIFGYSTADTGQAASITGLSTSEVQGSVLDPGPAGVTGILASSTINGWSAGVLGRIVSDDTSGCGVRGTHSGSGVGVYGYSGGDGFGVYAANAAPDAVALFCSGGAVVSEDLQVSGTLSKSGGSFKIDHPLEPETKTLSHSFVESPDMMNIYNGNVVLDGSGRARVAMPDWFSALNRDFRYQLTPIGGPGQVWVAQELTSDNTFEIGGPPHSKVSWQITGIRHDRWAEANRIPVVEDKPLDEVGTYLNPEAFGQPASMRKGYIDPLTGERGPVR